MTKRRNIENGTIARYTGKGHPGLTGCIVKVIEPILDDDSQPIGAYDVQPFIESEGRFSWVTSDAEADALKLLPASEAVRYDRDDPTYLILAVTDKSGPLG
jgi:hypothetical protein